jgi:hypothetical protein
MYEVHLHALWTTPPGLSQTHGSLDFEAILSDQPGTVAGRIHLEDGDLNDAQRALFQTDLLSVLTKHNPNDTRTTTILRLLFPSVGSPNSSHALATAASRTSLIQTTPSTGCGYAFTASTIRPASPSSASTLIGTNASR